MAKLAKKTGQSRRRLSLKAVSIASITDPNALNAATILKYTHESAKALLGAYESMRESRGAARGMTTDAEQDVLRAMLVMAAAGLDGMAKQLIRDTLPILVHRYPEVQEGLEKFITRQIRGDANAPELATGTKFLARVLAAESQQRQVIEEYIRELTGGSLQSVDELMRVAAAFGLKSHQVGIDPNKLKDVFDVRNKIIHELDIDLAGERRKRNIRKQKEMKEATDLVLSIGFQLVSAVDSKLQKSA